jgi:hypothetical protein
MTKDRRLSIADMVKIFRDTTLLISSLLMRFLVRRQTHLPAGTAASQTTFPPASGLRNIALLISSVPVWHR